MKKYIGIVVFMVGLIILGAELSASRLMAPYFGTSLPVWSALIGLILLALSLGYWIGGQWADRSPRPATLFNILGISGILLSLTPIIAQPVLGWSLKGFAQLEAGILAGSFVGVTLILGLPMILLGCVAPFAIRLSIELVDETGRVAGRLYALSTLGSFLGTLLPTLVLIPWIGTRATYLLFAMGLTLLSAGGYFLLRDKMRGIVFCVISLVILGLSFGIQKKAIKPGTQTLFEGESPYQYVRVEERKDGWRTLSLNEGYVHHSRYHPDFWFTFGTWDYLTFGPFFNPAPHDVIKGTRDWAIIGAGAGTTIKLLRRLYGNELRIHGVELDPLVHEVAERFFDFKREDAQIDIADGRAWIALNTNRYDVIMVDAYKQPYIPFELSTVEFFTALRDHLNPTGVISINVANPSRDDRLVNALAATMDAVMEQVYIIRIPKPSAGAILIGTRHAITLDEVYKNFNAAEAHAVSVLIHYLGKQHIERYEGKGLVMTDDQAPVERLMDLMIFEEIARQTK
ncbi:MAG: fused MFS/spermidine synthase [Verrucomicrobiota bacterium]